MQGKATFKGHPIHPMLVPFPIAFRTGPLIADVLRAASADAGASQAARRAGGNG